MKKVTRGLLVLAVAGTMATLAACSSSEMGPNGDGDAIPPPTDAQTDAVPAANAENPGDLSAAADPNAAPPPADPNAALPAPDGAPPAGDLAAAPPPVDPNAAPPAPDAAPAPAPAPDAAPAPAPVADAAPVAPVADAGPVGGGGTESYTIQQGDTLMKIAFETYGDLYQWKKIYDDNKDKISNPNSLNAGAVLKLDKPSSPVSIERNGEKYMIKKGDTLGTIAEDVYGTKTKWKKIWKNNKQLIKDPNKIFAGFFLYYTMTPEERQFKDQHQTAPAPLADNSAPTDVRAPSSVDPMAPPAPAMVPAPAPAPAPMAPAAPMAAAPPAGAPGMVPPVPPVGK